MHPHAEAWDLYHFLGGRRSVPRNRPCDFCGKPVPEGFIHPSCFWLELRETRQEVILKLGPAPEQMTGSKAIMKASKTRSLANT